MQKQPTNQPAAGPGRIIRVMLVEDHPPVARGIRSYTRAVDDVELVGVCERGDDVLPLVAKLKPDIVIIDPKLDGSQVQGLEVAGQLRRAYPDIRTLILSAEKRHDYVLAAMLANVDGYITKAAGGKEIVKAIRDVYAGGSYYSGAVNDVIQEILARGRRGVESSSDIDPSQHDPLTPQELRVLGLVAQGLSNKEIGLTMYIAPSTVKDHVSSILSKLGLNNRDMAALYYRRYMQK